MVTSKYGVKRQADPRAAGAAKVRAVLDDVRAALGGKPYLLGELTFADVAIAASLQALRPRKDKRLGPATREIWQNDVLASEYGDLLEWRDAVYKKHRPGA